MIPRILHQTARTADIAPRWRELREKARALNPGWEYRLWTDADNLSLVSEAAPKLLRSIRGSRATS